MIETGVAPVAALLLCAPPSAEACGHRAMRLKARVSKQRGEIADLKMKLKEATADNQGAVIGKLQKQLGAARYTRDESMAATKRMEYRLKKAEKERNEALREVEGQVISLEY